ncbi:ABC transporter permease [Taibaiella soli]|uniref:ABC transporter permease n=1 Tax=Taibaiella soli TaxID=1649169 RepID=A0A2W2C305_9BACT|nr:ABC transporter permease [Taibaiella soli]PZF74483.1 ABC transporter permease [Taibaiella soli]
MRTIILLLQKEFRQIFRNKALLPILFVAPIMQLLILPLAADYEVKNINLTVVDHDHSDYSHKLTSKITASGYFRLAGNFNSYKEALKQIEGDASDLILEIPQGFERDLIRENTQKVFVAVDAINGIKAGLGGAYLGRIIADFNGEIRMKWTQPNMITPGIDIASSNWYNVHMEYTHYMVPGILALLVTLVGGLMSALNIVIEKEIGTIEQINVSPIRKYHFIIGKLIPFWILGMFIFTIGLFVIARLAYGIFPMGSIPALYLFVAVYLIALLGFGLLISTYCNNQQQAMSVAFFFILIFNLMSGLFTPIDSMPGWAQTVAKFNPVAYLIDVMRMVVLKGSGFKEIKTQLLTICAFALVLNSWAVINYRKRS